MQIAASDGNRPSDPSLTMRSRDHVALQASLNIEVLVGAAATHRIHNESNTTADRLLYIFHV